MKTIQVQRTSNERVSGGRPKALTKSQLLHAIHYHATASPTELVQKLQQDGFEVSRTTIHRRLKEIDPEILAALLVSVTDDELKPDQRPFSSFKHLQAAKDYSDNLLYVREVSQRYHDKMLRDLHWICKTLNKRPQALKTKASVDLCADLVIRIKKGEVKRSLEHVMTSMRSWYLHLGISGAYLTSKGITGERTKGRGTRSDVKLSQAQRHKFLAVVQSHFNQDWNDNGYTIPFLSEPQLCEAMTCCIKFLYYTGTRRTATLKATWNHVNWGNPITIVKVIDKGRHKLGRITWNKKVAGEFLDEFKAYWERLGCPDTGRIFPLDPSTLTVFFNHCFAEAQIPQKVWKRIPVHIWRHTACQDMLLATDWHEEQTAKLLGWESKDTMTRHYGKAPPTVVNRGLLKAMGLPVPPEQKHEFKF
jgi:integrase